MSTRPQPIQSALDQSAALAQLVRRVRESQQRFADIQACLPAGLQQHLSPGPVDDVGWTLLAANASVAAKLRHLLPRLEEKLQQQGWPAVAVRVKIKGA